MSRLPVVGGDDGTWGTILNDFLSQSLTSSGALAANTVTSSQLATGSVTAPALAAGSVTNAALASSVTLAESQITNLTTDLASKAPTASPTFTGTVSGITAAMVGAAPKLAAYIDNYGADPTGASDSTTAFQNALAALPTTTIYSNPPTNTTGATTYHYGTLIIGSGTYKIGSTADIGNLGPLVNVVGAGRNASILNYYGGGDALRIYNAVKPADNNFDNLVTFHGTVNGFTIDGTHAQAGARGLHYGDVDGGILGPDLMIQNFVGGQMQPPIVTLGTTASSGGSFSAGSYYWRVTAINAIGETGYGPSSDVNASLSANGTQSFSWTSITGATGYKIYRGTSYLEENVLVATVSSSTTSYTDTGSAGTAANPPMGNVVGSIGLYLDNSVSWTNNIVAKVNLFNCDNAVVMRETTGDADFKYNDMSFRIYAYAKQQAVVLQNGANYEYGSLAIRGKMAMGSTAAANAAFSLIGTLSTPAMIQYSRLDIQMETTLSGSNGPLTIFYGFPYTNGNLVNHCQGVLSFGNSWSYSNWSETLAYSSSFIYAGIISGDGNLSPNTGSAALTISGSTAYTQTIGGYSGSTMYLQFNGGDYLYATITQNTTIAFSNNVGGSQRKKIFFNTQGSYSVSWPTNASPTVIAPTVIWPAGVAPNFQVNGYDVVILETTDGQTWYGQLISQLPAVPISYGPVDAGQIAWSFDPALSTSTISLGSSSSSTLLRIKMAQTATITNVLLYISSPATTVTQSAVRIFDINGNLLAQTADISTIITSGGAKTIPLVTPLAVTVGTLLLVSIFVNASTMPSMTASPSYNAASSSMGQTTSNYRASRYFTTTLPASIVASNYSTTLAQTPLIILA